MLCFVSDVGILMFGVVFGVGCRNLNDWWVFCLLLCLVSSVVI